MKVKDKVLKKWVDVIDEKCPKRSCYWPRPDPGVFVQGRGYQSRPGRQGWLCGTREIRGCPHPNTCESCGRPETAMELENQCWECSKK